MGVNKCLDPSRVHFGTATILVYFNLILNDIGLDIVSTICLFAGDISLYMIVDNSIKIAITLNQDLAKIFARADKW